jgi:protein-tyrosine phosphatase
MIDTHCHLLPGLDDGPRTVREALQLAQMMVADGITSVL